MKSKAKDELLEFSSEESHSEDDEDGWKLTEEVEKEFFKTLSRIKNKDPKIYEKDVDFFKNISIPENKVSKASKINPFTLRDYERKLVVEKGGELSDEEPLLSSSEKHKEPTYVEEQELLKNRLKSMINSDSEDENDQGWGGLFKKRDKTAEEEKKEEEDYKEWLKGQRNSAPDKEVEKDMMPLHDYWTNPDLKSDDQFLRDYILNKKYLKHDNDDDTINIEKILEEPENDREENEFEEKYNHRFEEPDQEFIKRYPRVMENSIRRKNDHRKQKREEVKERKLKEKQKKKAEVKNKMKLKKKEIEDKIDELKKLTGNDQLAFENVLDNDFDLNEHDKAMQRLFNDEFYSKNDPDFDPSGYTGCEDNWNDTQYDEAEEMVEVDDEPVHCEDPGFNMDCDYNPAQTKPKVKDCRSRRRKDKHRRTTVSEVVNQEKPKFDPTVHKSFQEYIDQYYAVDCEDFIGDLACRFKYRRTIPNSYGLTVEEILTADPKELDRWCSIKRIHQLRPEYKEKCDVKVYGKKAADEQLKKKILPSLFQSFDNSQTVKTDKKNSKSEIENSREGNFDETNYTKLNNTETQIKPTSTNNENISKIKKKNKPKKLTHTTQFIKEENCIPVKRKRTFELTKTINKKKKSIIKNNEHKKFPSKKNVKNKISKYNKPTDESSIAQMSDARLLAYGIKPKKFRNKLKYNKGVP